MGLLRLEANAGMAAQRGCRGLPIRLVRVHHGVTSFSHLIFAVGVQFVTVDIDGRVYEDARRCCKTWVVAHAPCSPGLAASVGLVRTLIVGSTSWSTLCPVYFLVMRG